MGREQRGRGQYILFLFTILIGFLLEGCLWQPPAQRPQGPKPEELALGQVPQLIYQGHYKEAKEICLSVKDKLSDAQKAASFYYLALIYADPESPLLDIQKAKVFLQKIEQKYPQSPWGISARIWLKTLAQRSRCEKQLRAFMAQKRRQEQNSRCPLLLAQGRFQKALKICLDQAQKAKGPEKAASLYYLALLYADPQNPERNLAKALAYFKEVEQNWPQTTWGLEARIWSDNIHALEELKSLNIELEKTKERIETR